MLRELVAQPHCIHVYSSCKVTIKYVYTIDLSSKEKQIQIWRHVYKLSNLSDCDI